MLENSIVERACVFVLSPFHQTVVMKEVVRTRVRSAHVLRDILLTDDARVVRFAGRGGSLTTLLVAHANRERRQAGGQQHRDNRFLCLLSLSGGPLEHEAKLTHDGAGARLGDICEGCVNGVHRSQAAKIARARSRA